jgi:hypothetical protein
MSHKFLKGNREYHIIQDDNTSLTNCGYNFVDAGKEGHEETEKSKPEWPTCAACEHGPLPEEVLKLRNIKTR